MRSQMWNLRPSVSSMLHPALAKRGPAPNGYLTCGRLLCVIAMAMCLVETTLGATIVFNNGLTPTDPSNVIDDTSFERDTILVRNVGCGTSDPVDGICVAPGAPTTLAVLNGAVVETMSARDSSTILISGGDIPGAVSALETASVSISGGFVNTYRGSNEAMLDLVGGTVGGLNFANSAVGNIRGGFVDAIGLRDTSEIEIEGNDFRVDGNAVGYGELIATSGELTGTLRSGGTLRTVFNRESGAILRLVPEPMSDMPVWLIMGLAIVCLGLWRRTTVRFVTMEGTAAINAASKLPRAHVAQPHSSLL